MTPQQQAYIEGFVKRANEYGFSNDEAVAILKQAAELKGDQHKLDVDKDGKIEGSDLKKLRQRKEAAEAPLSHPSTYVPGTADAKAPLSHPSTYNIGSADAKIVGAARDFLGKAKETASNLFPGAVGNPQGQTMDSRLAGGINPNLNISTAKKTPGVGMGGTVGTMAPGR